MENTPKTGCFKIFLGYAPEVGKTQAMLDAALQKKLAGMGVVIGCLVPRGLKSYSDLLKGLGWSKLDAIPFNLDLDSLLSLHPDLVIVDDLAADNPAGARHPHRYQDVDELLAAGIDVFSTLNIQELESLRDVMAGISEKIIRKTIPDRVFQQASVVELIDLPPDEIIWRLERRLESGELDRPEVEPYLSVEVLTRLRQIALRRTAGNIKYPDTSLDRSIKNIQPGGVLVCVSSHPLSEKLIRAGKRRADEQHIPWHVLFVETPERVRPIEANRERLEHSLALAEELGATIHRQTSLDISRAIVAFIRQNNIASVIVGAPRHTRHGLFERSQVERMVARIDSTELVIIRDDHKYPQPAWPLISGRRSPWPEYVKTLLIIALVTGISYPLHLVIEPVNLVMIYLVAVTACAFYLGRGPALLASLTSVLAFDYFMVAPRFSLTIADTQYLLTFFGFFLISLVISSLVGRIRSQVDASRQREEMISALYSLSQELTEAYDRNSVIATILRQIQNTFVRQCTLWLKDGDDLMACPENSANNNDEITRPVAWALENRRPAGRGTDTYPDHPSMFYPMITGMQAVGVIEVRKEGKSVLMNLEKRNLMEAYSGIAALAIERTRLLDEQKKSQLVLETERLQNALLNSISHDLRTPLATISGVLSSLREAELPEGENVSYSKQTRREMLDFGWEEAQRLNRIVGNLLDITRLESGALKLNFQSGDLEGVVGAVLACMKPRLFDFEVKVDVAPDLPPLLFDPGLIEQVMTNILDNAIKFSGRAKKIVISVIENNDEVKVSIKDYGKGVAKEEMEKIFDKFYRAKGSDGIPGSGLGLSICKGIIQAHGGSIGAEANIPHGLIINFILPVGMDTK